MISKEIIAISLLLVSSTLVTPAFGETAYCKKIAPEEHSKYKDAVYDGHLTFEESLYWYRCGKGQSVSVDASQLTIHRSRPWNADRWALGVVQGLNDFLVHGRVGMFNHSRGVVIQAELFNFDNRDDASWIREVEVYLGSKVIGKGHPFTIHFKGTPTVITNGWTFSQ